MWGDFVTENTAFIARHNTPNCRKLKHYRNSHSRQLVLIPGKWKGGEGRPL